MTDLSPYQITSAKSAPVLPPKVQATSSVRPYYACDMSKISAQQALRFELELAAAWKASAQAEHHRAAVPQFVEGSGLRKNISQPCDATLAIMRRVISKTPKSLWTIRQQSGLPRATAYNAIKWMLQHGEVKQVDVMTRGKTVNYFCHPDTVIKEKRAKLDRYNGIPVTIRGIKYPSYNAAAAELGISPQTVYWHFNRGTLDTCGLGTGWKVTPTMGDDGKIYPSISKAAKASGISKQAMAGRKKVKA